VEKEGFSFSEEKETKRLLCLRACTQIGLGPEAQETANCAEWADRVPGEGREDLMCNDPLLRSGQRIELPVRRRVGRFMRCKPA
jgi:hypothetical protein